MSDRGVLVTRSTAEWATSQQRQSRPLTGHRTPVGQGILDRPSGGIWFYGQVQSVDTEAKTAVVSVEICTYGHNPANADGEVTISWEVDAGVTVELPIPTVGSSGWFQFCQVPGDIQGAERSPPKWVQFSAGCASLWYFIAQGMPDGGTATFNITVNSITEEIEFPCPCTLAETTAALETHSEIVAVDVSGGTLPAASQTITTDPPIEDISAVSFDLVATSSARPIYYWEHRG